MDAKVQNIIKEAIESVASEIATDPTYSLSLRRFLNYLDDWFLEDVTDDLLKAVRDYVYPNWNKIELDIYGLVDKWNEES